MKAHKSKCQASNFTSVDSPFNIILILCISFVIIIDTKLISHLDEALDIVPDSQPVGRSHKPL